MNSTRVVTMKDEGKVSKGKDGDYDLVDCVD